MNKKITFGIIFFLLTLILQAENESVSIYTSAYTSIDQQDCVTLDSDNVGSIQECESFSGIGVKVIEGDLRQSIILTRNEQEYDLDFTSLISTAFSSLGLKLEWRHELSNPKNLKGMIVRFEVSDDYEDLEHVSSYLVVSKITKEEICVVAKVLPQQKQNEIARDILDKGESLPCLKKSEETKS